MKFIKVITPSGEMYININMIVSFQYFRMNNYTLVKVIGRDESIVVQGDLSLRLMPDNIRVDDD